MQAGVMQTLVFNRYVGNKFYLHITHADTDHKVTQYK